MSNYTINKPKETKVILVNGYKRSGKDYVSQIIKSELEKRDKSVSTIAFADAMKNILSSTFKLDVEELDDLKNNPDHLFSVDGGITEYNMRTIIVNFGQVIKQLFGSYFWRDIVIKYIKENEFDYVIVTDFRFPDEYIDGYCVYIKNDDIEQDKSEITENSMNDWEYDFVIDNTGKPSNDVLIEQITEMLKN